MPSLEALFSGAHRCPAAQPIYGATDGDSGCVCGVMLNDSRRRDSILEGGPIGVYVAARTDPSTLIKWCFGDMPPPVDPDRSDWVSNYTTCPVWLAEWELRHLASERVGGVFLDDEQEEDFDLMRSLMAGDAAPGWSEDPVEDLSAREQADLLFPGVAQSR